MVFTTARVLLYYIFIVRRTDKQIYYILYKNNQYEILYNIIVIIGYSMFILTTYSILAKQISRCGFATRYTSQHERKFNWISCFSLIYYIIIITVENYSN